MEEDPTFKSDYDLDPAFGIDLEPDNAIKPAITGSRLLYTEGYHRCYFCSNPTPQGAYLCKTCKAAIVTSAAGH